MPGTFQATKHPRGQPKNRGQFGRKGTSGSGGAKPPTRADLLNQARDLEHQAAVLTGGIGNPGTGVTATIEAGRQAKALRQQAKALRAQSAAMLRRQQAATGVGGFDPSKHPRGPDGRFISAAQVEEYKRAGNWPPKPVTKPSRKTPVRPKPVEMPTPKAKPAEPAPPKVPEPAAVPRVKAYAGATDAAVEIHARVLETGAAREAAERRLVETRVEMDRLERESDLLQEAVRSGAAPRGTKAQLERIRKASLSLWEERKALHKVSGAPFQAEREAAREVILFPAEQASPTTFTMFGTYAADGVTLTRGGEPPAAVKEGHAFFARLVGRGSVLDNTDLVVAVHDDPKYRANASFGGIVSVSTSDGADVAVHEFAHHVEYNDTKPLIEAVAFREKRRAEAGEWYRKLGDLQAERSGVQVGYGDDEVGFGDKLFDPYCGKKYEGDRLTEVLTMGAQQMYRDPTGFARQDPEYFQMVLTVLQGSRRKP